MQCRQTSYANAVKKGPGRDEDIGDKHRSWIEKVYTVFIQRNVLALQNEPTPYKAGREKNVNIPSDVVLRTALIE